MTWFDDLTGFRESSPAAVRENLFVEGQTLVSRANGRRFHFGRLETPSLAELRARVETYKARGETSGNHTIPRRKGGLVVREIVSDIQSLHLDRANSGALFQVASQFNLLEMTHPGLTPEDGVGRYEDDRTQGPACAIAAGAGTIYRNYFAPLDGLGGHEKSLTGTDQINCLADMEAGLRNDEPGDAPRDGGRGPLWQMKNGYALATREGLAAISKRLERNDENGIDRIREKLRIGIQWDTQVTLENSVHRVTQVYCSALPVSYCAHPDELWEPFARLILEGAYEATLCAAVLNSVENGNGRVFLTLLGGGVFGNDMGWIIDSIRRALLAFSHWDLEVALVSYGRSKRWCERLAAEFGG